MLSDDVLEKYHQAGKIAAKVREEMKKTTKEGMLVIEVCEKTESLIKRLGGKPAFPCNVSINEIAAHYTSPLGDKTKIPSGSLVKIDIGVHIDGYIVDTAVTVCFNPEYEGMVRTTEEALEKAVKTIKSGISTSQLGSAIQKEIEIHGFKPVSNLTGHQVGRYLIHTGKSLPNVSHFSINKINFGDVCAIEPFVTVKDAEGVVTNAPEAYIFRFVKNKLVRNAEPRKLLKFIESNFKTLPFTERWLQDFTSSPGYRPAFGELLSSKSIMSYPVFVEASSKFVAQAEHTVYIDKEKNVVLTAS